MSVVCVLPPTKTEALYSPPLHIVQGVCVLPPTKTEATDEGACVLPPPPPRLKLLLTRGRVYYPTATDEEVKEKPVHWRIDIQLVQIDQYFIGILYFTGKYVR